MNINNIELQLFGYSFFNNVNIIPENIKKRPIIVFTTFSNKNALEKYFPFFIINLYMSFII